MRLGRVPEGCRVHLPRGSEGTRGVPNECERFQMEKSAGKPKNWVLAGNNAPKREVTLCACAIQDGGPEVPSIPEKFRTVPRDSELKKRGKSRNRGFGGKTRAGPEVTGNKMADRKSRALQDGRPEVTPVRVRACAVDLIHPIHPHKCRSNRTSILLWTD